MNENEFFHVFTIIWMGLGILVFLVLLFIPAPYGRHWRGGWGPQIPARTGWIIMESPAVILFLLFFLTGGRSKDLMPIVFLLMWLLHYVNRSVIFPFRNRNGKKTMPLVIALFALFFNIINAYLQGRYLGSLSQPYPAEWLWDPRFIGGLLLFIFGFALNLGSDEILMDLRRSDERGYQIPRGGLFKWVSCPNYLGEIIEWIGWAVATWSLPGLAFAIWTIANLGPRAYTHHQWYRKEFPDYPKGRKALVPFIL